MIEVSYAGLTVIIGLSMVAGAIITAVCIVLSFAREFEGDQPGQGK